MVALLGEVVQDVGSKRVTSNYLEKIIKKCSGIVSTNSSVAKCLGIVSTNSSVASASLSNPHRLTNCDNKVSKSVKHSVVPSANIKLQNRFHVLSSVDPGPLEFEDNIILDTSTVGNNHLPKPDIAKSRYFGHSGTNDGNQTMAKESIAHKKCCEQIGTKFGCIPVGEITVFSGISTHWKDIPNIFQAHKLIRSSGRPNFLGLRIPVDTSLKVDNWRHYLFNYFDQQLPDLIEFGFPLDFDRTTTLGVTEDNHPSANKFIKDIDAYISEELSHRAMMGPFHAPPFPLHISPFLTREKPGSDTRRTIIDLSWPKLHSVNDGVLNNEYLGTEFQLHYPSIDDFVKRVVQLGPACKLFKIDISRAFRHLRIDPGDIDLLGLKHKGQVFVDLSLPFGYCLGSIFSENQPFHKVYYEE